MYLLLTSPFFFYEPTLFDNAYPYWTAGCVRDRGIESIYNDKEDIYYEMNQYT